MKFLNHIDLAKTEIRNFAVQVLGSAPTAPVIGQTYYDSVAKQVLSFDGGSWNNDATKLAGQLPSFYTNAGNLSTGTILSARLPAFTGDATSTAGTSALTLATVNSNVGTFGAATKVAQVTVNAKGLVTAVTEVVIAPAWSSITGTPTTLSGYKITDAQPLNSTLTSLSGSAWSSGTQVVTLTAANTVTLKTVGQSSGNILDRTAGDALYASLATANSFTGDQTVTGQIIASNRQTAKIASTANFANTTPTSTVLTASATGSTTIDGNTLALNDIVLLKDQTNARENGVYKVTTAGSTGVATVLTRVAQLSTWANVATSTIVIVQQGTANADTMWVCTADPGGTLGTTSINFNRVVFSGDSITGSAASVANSLTFTTTGGAAAGATFNGSAPRTIDYSTIGAQQASTQLTAVAGAAWSAGTQVLTLTAANTVTLKTVGSATGNILDKAAGDALYQPTSANLTALAGAAWSAGTQVLTLTAANTVTLKTVGSATGNILDKASGDALYLGITATATNSSQLGGQAGSYYLSRANHTGTQTASTISDLATTVQGYRLDQFAAPTAPVSLNTQKITSLADPTNPQDAATKNYVDVTVQSSAAGIDSKASVRLVATGNIALSGTGTAIDGVTTVAGDRVLATGQSTASQNGVYVVGSGAWVRATDADQTGEITPGAFWFVEEGTTFGKSQWRCNNTGTVTLGTTAITIVQFGAAASYTASNGVQLVGNNFSILLPANSGLVADGTGLYLDTTVAARKYSATIGDGTTTAIAVTHSLGTKDVVVSVRDAATDATIITDWTATSTTQVTINFATAPTLNAYRVTVIG